MLPFFLVWVICLIASFAYFIMSIASLLASYYSYPVIIQVSIESNDSPVDFPGVTIYNLNPFNRTDQTKDYINKVPYM